jgi:polyferredoxin
LHNDNTSCKKMKIPIKTNPYRLAIQLIILLLLIYMLFRAFFDRTYVADFESYCPFGGMLAFSSFLVNNSLACSMTGAQIVMGAALILAIILFSKLFCSFICPVGTISEMIGKLGDKLKLRYTITGYADILLRGLKYGILFITIYYTVNSSELFCKKFDPYYASVSGFASDVALFWGIVTISIVIFGSFFIRLFWCKYLCPIGGISNIFRFFFTFLAVTGIYLILRIAGVSLNFVWPIAVICGISFFLEFYSLKSKTFPLNKIRRHTEICTNCKLCTKYCPQAIDVASLETIKHIDCYLCADCIHICPEEGALTINKRGKKWLPALVTLILILAALIIGRTFEIPTLSQYWGEKGLEGKMVTFTKSGLKSVKCFGSSTAFSNQMRRVSGVTGVTTFVKTNTVKILYDPSVTDTTTILRSIFSPVKVKLKNSAPSLNSLNEFSLSVDNFFDPLDAVYLKEIISENNDIYGFSTEFECPVKIRIYTDASSALNAEILSKLVETGEVKQPQPNGKILTIKLNYKVKRIERSELALTPEEFAERMYYRYFKSLNERNILQSSTYTVLFPGGGSETTNLMLEKLVYHLAQQPGIDAVESFSKNSQPFLTVYFDKKKISQDDVHNLLNSSKILSSASKGEKVYIDNPLSFPFKGETITK